MCLSTWQESAFETEETAWMNLNLIDMDRAKGQEEACVEIRVNEKYLIDYLSTMLRWPV